jgi:ATP-dependent DNA helicase RecG
MENADIERLIAHGEGEQLEFKSNFNDSTIETVVAFANTRGGSIIIGVNDRKKVVSNFVVGSETVQNWINELKNKTNPSVIPDIDIYQIEGQPLALIQVKEFPIKPVSFKGKYYKRVKNSNHQLSITEVVAMHLKTFNLSWDSYVDTNHTLSDISLEKVERFIAIENKLKEQPIEDGATTFLTKHELLKGESITHGCYLLFSADGNTFRGIELGRFSDEVTIKDAITLRSDIVGEVNSVMDFITKHLNKGYRITGKAEREEVWDYPLEAIRETVINMIVHRDYTSASDSVVKIFDDRIEFFNTGRLSETIKIENLFTGNYVSETRNKQISLIFKELGWIEKMVPASSVY